jgi:hypothetical protein
MTKLKCTCQEDLGGRRLSTQCPVEEHAALARKALESYKLWRRRAGLPRRFWDSK